MKPNSRVFLILPGCLPGIAAGFAGGWFAARKNASAGDGAARVANTTPAVASLPGHSGAAAGSIATATLLKSLKNPRSQSSRLAIFNHVAGMSLEELKSELEKKDKSKVLAGSAEGTFLQAVVCRWAELDPEGLLAHARASGDMSYRMIGLTLAFQELGRRDPESAWSLTSEMGVMKELVQNALLQSLAEENPARALELVKGDLDSSNGWALGSLFGAWVERDPAAAAAAIASLKGTRHEQPAIRGLMERWAKRDYDAAAAWAAGLNAPQRATAMSAALGTVAETEPEKALKLLDSVDIGSSREDVVRQAIRSLALRDFDTALEMALEFKNFRDKTGALTILANEASGENRERLLTLAAELPANVAKSIYESNLWQQAWSDPKELLRTVEGIPHAAMREQIMRQAVGSLAYSDPGEGGRLFLNLQPSSQDPGTAQNIAGNLANRDPEQAVKWAESLGTDALKTAALSGALQQWAAVDPEAAGRQISKIANPETRAEVARSVAQGVAQRSLTEAEQWAATLSGADRAAALGVVTRQAAQEDPERALTSYAKFAASLSPEDAARSENQAVAREVASRLAQTDATTAAAWALALPEGGARDEAVSGVVASWAAWDAPGASEWVNSLPPGDGRDRAAVHLVNTIARDDPDSAWAWANAIADPARRREAAAAALDGWKANGQRDAARAALENGNFSDSERRELIRRLE